MNTELGQYIAVLMTVLAATIAVGTFAYRKVWPWLRGKVKSMFGIKTLHASLEDHALFVSNNLSEIHKRQKAIEISVAQISKEFKPNSGETTRDSLNRIEMRVDLFGEIQQALMLETGEMIARSDAAGNVVWVNRTLARKTRRLPGELLGNGWFNIIHSEDRELVRQSWRQAVKEKRDLETVVRIVSTDGEVIKASCKAYAMHDYRNEILGWVSSFKELYENERRVKQ